MKKKGMSVKLPSVAIAQMKKAKGKAMKMKGRRAKVAKALS